MKTRKQEIDNNCQTIRKEMTKFYCMMCGVIYVRTWKKLFEQLSDFCRLNAYSSVMNAIARSIRGKLCYQEIECDQRFSEENRQKMEET